jgi:hypothetical protein
MKTTVDDLSRKYSTQVFPIDSHEGRNQAGGAGVMQSAPETHLL